MSIGLNKNSDLSLDLNNLAAISLTVYTRLEHFCRCIESLAANDLAKYSTLYIFSDAPKEGDEESVRKVRAYAENIAGFKEVILKFQVSNDYLKNVRDAREIPMIHHDRMIRMEDDNVVSPFFLEFMNQALEFYKDNEMILGVTGYSPPVNQHQYINCNVYLSHFWSGWTSGVWKHKDAYAFLTQQKPYADMLRNKLYSRVRDLHPKLHLALKRMDEGTHIAGDQKLTYYMIKNGLYQIKPVKSLVQNIGHDGSGVHCGHSDRFNQKPYCGRLVATLDNLEYLPELDRLQYRYFYKSRSLMQRIIGKIRRIGLKVGLLKS
jgi:hypothetical protein